MSGFLLGTIHQKVWFCPACGVPHESGAWSWSDWRSQVSSHYRQALRDLRHDRDQGRAISRATPAVMGRSNDD